MKTHRAFLPALLLLGGSLFCAPPSGVTVDQIIWDRELIITDLYPVQKCTDAQPGDVTHRFTLEHLLAGLRQDKNPETAARQWLQGWVSEQDGQTLHVGEELLKRWAGLARTGPECPPAGQLCFKHAPFKLLAIVNRPDQQERDANFEPHSAGEVRFVFGLVDDAGGSLKGTVIFEYGMKGQTLDELHDWQDQWHQLLAQVPFSDAYCDALAKITEQVTGWPSAALKKIRTNEQGLSRLQVKRKALWNLREFCLDSGAIVATTIEQTPSSDWARDRQLIDYINTEEKHILASTYRIPPFFGARSFLGRQANIPQRPLEPFWFTPKGAQAMGLKNPAAGSKFVRNTCNGCHGSETLTNNVHIALQKGKPALLSGFIKTGNTQEIMDRKTVMCAALNRTPLPPPASLPGGTPPPNPASVELLHVLLARAGNAH